MLTRANSPLLHAPAAAYPELSTQPGTIARKAIG
jgi:hypothetical protein